MKHFVNKYWKTILFFILAGLVGGFFTGIYMLDSYPAEIQKQILDQGISQTKLGYVAAIQYATYGCILGVLGILLGKKTNLWKDEKSITRKPLTLSIVFAIIGGLIMIFADILFFGRYSEAIMNTYAVKPAIAYVLAGVLVGGVIEEVMLRLFVMSLIAFILHKLFGKKNDKPTTAILIISNIIAAILFAAGHLPATFILLGNSPLIIFRCFLLNGGFGLLFGYLYRKYGLRYSMIAHGGCHIVSKLIWILFV